MKYRMISLALPKRRYLLLLTCGLLLSACAEKQQDFCQYLSLEEARLFDANIVRSEMRQTRALLFCVWSDGASDRLFMSLDRALDYTTTDFLKVVAQNSTERYRQVVPVPGVGNEAAALYLGEEEPVELEFLIAQDQRYSITLKAPGVRKSDAEKLDALNQIANLVLSRL